MGAGIWVEQGRSCPLTLDPRPRGVGTPMMNVSTGAPNRPAALSEGSVRFTAADTRSPAVGLLSNGRYSVMISAAGAGYSSWRDLDVTRWREDGTRDCWGQFCYVRDLGEGKLWSVGHKPVGRPADDYEVVFSPWRA